MVKYVMFVGSASVLFVLQIGGLFFDQAYAAEALNGYLGKDPASLDPQLVEMVVFLVRTACLLGAAASFVSIYLFRVMVQIERGRVTAFLGLTFGGGLSLGTTIVALNVMNQQALFTLTACLAGPIVIATLMGLFSDPVLER